MSASKKPFSELGLHSWLIQQLSSLHMKNATPVQVHFIIFEICILFNLSFQISGILHSENSGRL